MLPVFERIFIQNISRYNFNVGFCFIFLVFQKIDFGSDFLRADG
jgi:hypothetical protein